MTQPLCEHLRWLCVKSVYWSCFALGLLPAPYNWKLQKFQISRLYNGFSVVIQFLFLIMAPFAVPISARPEGREKNYMQDLYVLQACYYLEKLTRIIANVVLFVVLLKKRKQIIDLYERYEIFKINYQDSHMRNEELQDEENEIAINLVYKLIMAHLSVIMSWLVTIRMQKHRDDWYYLLITANSLQAYHLVVANMALHLILSQMHLHFSYINKCLELMSEQKISRFTINSCWRLFNMHMECNELCLEIFALFRSVTLFTLIKVFTTNVILLYHAVLFYSGAIPSNGLDDFLGIVAIIAFYWDNFLVMAAISTVQITCNETGYSLGYLSSLTLKLEMEERQQLERETHIAIEDVELVDNEKFSRQFSQMAHQFHFYLDCNELDYNFFDMFSLSRESIFGYFVSAFEYLIILIQFDLTLRA